jgi:hypothetical protein
MIDANGFEILNKEVEALFQETENLNEENLKLLEDLKLDEISKSSKEA